MLVVVVEVGATTPKVECALVLFDNCDRSSQSVALSFLGVAGDSSLYGDVEGLAIALQSLRFLQGVSNADPGVVDANIEEVFFGDVLGANGAIVGSGVVDDIIDEFANHPFKSRNKRSGVIDLLDNEVTNGVGNIEGIFGGIDKGEGNKTSCFVLSVKVFVIVNFEMFVEVDAREIVLGLWISSNNKISIFLFLFHSPSAEKNKGRLIEKTMGFGEIKS